MGTRSTHDRRIGQLESAVVARGRRVAARRRRVLVVEDDSVIATAIAAHLRAAGYEVDAVDDGLRALRRIRYAGPDAIVLDLMLPGTDGWQVIESVRADGIEAAVVVVSARVSERDRVHALRLGADDYLCKPFGMPELVRSSSCSHAWDCRIAAL